MDGSPAEDKPQKNREEVREAVASIIGIVIVICVLALGGIYFFITEKAHFNSSPQSTQP